MGARRFFILAGSLSIALSLFSNPLFSREKEKIDHRLTSVGNGIDRGEGILHLGDGKIVVAGVTNYQKEADIALIRYQKDGRLDTTFGINGISRVFLPGKEHIFGIEKQKDGKIIAAGYTEQNGKRDLLLVRFFENGNLDPNFGEKGIVVTPLGENSEAHFLKLQKNGYIVVSGFSDHGGEFKILLARYRTDGKLDTSFGKGGLVNESYGISDKGYGLNIQEDGKILLAGSSREDEGEACLVARYQRNGKRDLGFGSDGLLRLALSLKSTVCSSIAVQNDKKIVVAGSALQEKRRADLLVARLLPSGELDRSFHQKGWLLKDFKKGHDIAHAVEIGRDNSIYVAGESAKRGGSSWKNRKARFVLLKLSSSGSIDNIAFASFKGGENASAEAMLLEKDGTIWLAGYAGKDFATARVYWSPRE